MLSYKEYKLLNESLYGAFNLGLRSQGTVGGIVSQSGINGTEAAIEAQSEEAIEEAKKMKKKMEDEEAPEEEVEEKDGDEESEEEKEEKEEEGDDEDSDEVEGDDEDSEEEEVKEEPKFMKKKAKKEWSEIVSDLEAILEDISDEGALADIKKGLETIKEGMKKGCGSKMMDKKCGKMMDKKCGKYMNEDEQAWWTSVQSMIGVQDQKGWDGGWSEIKDVATSLRDEERPV